MSRITTNWEMVRFSFGPARRKFYVPDDKLATLNMLMVNPSGSVQVPSGWPQMPAIVAMVAM